ncbi:MAG TPA: SRPBCC family protein [Candidatus Sulfotelmatobacter sp.]|nr:SRPBCC family protein [Candidatus Sulfotelmatobacter sp.]
MSSSTVDIPADAVIRAPAESIFAVIVDVDGQSRWLTKSSSFRGTTAVSSNQFALGTTYREPGPLGVRNGRVVEYERPTRIAFHQPMTLRFGLGTIDVTMRYTLEPGPQATTHVRRLVTIGIPRSLRLLRPVIVREFRAESARTLRALKAYCDGRTTG